VADPVEPQDGADEEYREQAGFDWDAKRTLVLDYTGDAVVRYAAPERAPTERTVRRVVGKARIKTDLLFSDGHGGTEVLAAGTRVELVEPTERDRSDLQSYQKASGKQHVVIRWGPAPGTVTLVVSSAVERI